MDSLQYAIAAAVYCELEYSYELPFSVSGEDCVYALDRWINEQGYDLTELITNSEEYSTITAWFASITEPLDRYFEKREMNYAELTGRDDYYLDIYYAATGAASFTEFWAWPYDEQFKNTIEQVDFKKHYPEIEIGNLAYDVATILG